MSDLGLVLNQSSGNYKDLDIQDGDLVMIDGLTEIQQNVLQRLSVFFGEWFMDTTIGIPYFNEILIKNPDQSKVDALFSNTISKTPGVIGLLSYSFTPDFINRTLNVSFSAQTTQGIVNYEGVLSV